MNRWKLARRARMGWRRHLLDCTVHVMDGCQPYRGPALRPYIAVSVYWMRLGVGECFDEKLRDEAVRHESRPRAVDRALARLLARARIEHPTARLVPSSKYGPGYYVFELVNESALTT